jgi:hypothetical protein
MSASRGYGFNVSGCTSSPTGFDPVASAGSYSSLAVVLAGVLFTGVVLLITLRPTAVAGNHRRTALEVMVPTFFTLLVTSFLFGVVAGEQVCRRADVEASSAGALLAISGVATFQAISWLLHSYEADNVRLSWIVTGTRFAVAAIGIAQLAVTSGDVRGQYRSSADGRIQFAVFIISAVIVFSTAFMAWFRRASLVRAWLAAPTLLVVLLPNVAIFDLAANRSPSSWQGAAAGPLVTIGEPITLAVFLVATAVHLLGAPERPRKARPADPAKHNPSPRPRPR